MRKALSLKAKVLQCLLAAILACGLMIPTAAFTAYGDEPDGIAGGITAMTQTEQGEATGQDDAQADSAATGQPGDAQSLDAFAGVGQEGDNVDGSAGGDDAVPENASQDQAITPLADAEGTTLGDFLVQGGTAGASAGTGDYYHDGSKLHVRTSTPITIKMAANKTSTAQTIEIDAGTQADVTLAGVNISTTACSPINMVTNSMDTASGAKATNADQIIHKTALYLTIADGTTNNLLFTNTSTALNTGWPGIRCGWGSTLVIDDSVTNVKAGGSKFNLDDIVTPENGMIGTDVTLLGGTALKAGDAIGKMESANAGVLVAQGGLHSAGIGSGPSENSGTLVINGGDITAKISVIDYVFNGSGIGGGGNGSGTIITINGGKVSAYGGGCGTAIGAGFGYHSSSHNGSTFKPDAIGVPTSINSYDLSQGYSFWGYAGAPYTYNADGVNDLANHTVQTGGTLTSFTVAGDITINGGYVYAKSGKHGNAIGQSCGHGPNTNRGHIIRITGGTVVAESQNAASSNPYMFGIGARLGYTIVTGGSVQVPTGTSAAYSGRVLFQGLGGTAYNTLGVTTWDDVVEKAGGDPVSSTGYTGHKLPDEDQVQMVQINLSEDVKENGTVPDKTVITDWELEIDNIVYKYGAPTYLDKGLAYVWVPKSANGKKVTVNMSYLDSAGNEHVLEPLYVEEVGGASGSTLKRYIDIDVDKLPADQAAYFNGLKKDYDGLTLEPFDIANHPIDTTGFEAEGKTLDDPSSVTTTYQLFDKVGGNALGEAVTGPAGTTMPADTGVFQVQFVSKQHAVGLFGNSYWGHRITAWAEIKPVPAVLKIASTEYGTLAEDGTWTPTTADSPDPGNRIRFEFAIRSAIGTAPTCAAPTGSVQVTLDGEPVGDPIPLTKEFIEASAGSSITMTDPEPTASKDSAEGRATTSVVYYLDPSRLDGQLSTGGVVTDKGTVHELSLEYIADKNYVQGVEANPDNADAKDTFIVPVKPTDEVNVEGPGDLKYDEASDLIVGNYGDFHGDGIDSDFFKLDFTSSSAAKVTYTSSNPAVADIVRDENGDPVFDENGHVKIQVFSCGETTINMTQPANALYNGINRDLRVVINPDPSLKPKVQIRLTWRNITAMQEGVQQVQGLSAGLVALAEQTVEDVASGSADEGSGSKMTDAERRAATPPRPGDVIEYTVTGLNLTEGSAWQAAELKDVIDAKMQFDPESVELAANYPTHDRDTSLPTDAFYKGYDWDALDWKDVPAVDYTFAAQTLSKQIGSVYGGQSTSVRFLASVPEGTGARPSDGKLPTIDNEPTGSGGYGKDVSDLAPGEEITPPAQLTVGTDPDVDDIVIMPGTSNVGGDPDSSGFPTPTPIIPKDPAAADIQTNVTVEIIGQIEEHTPDRILVGDTLRVTATSKNTAPDTKLVGGVIRVTLPVGYEPKPGTIKLVDAQGKTYDVPDSAYDPKTGIVAVNAGDIYGGEEASLYFDVDVLSTEETRKAEEEGTSTPGDNPGSNPGDNPGSNPGGTPGDTPGTDEPGDTPGTDTPGEDVPGGTTPSPERPQGPGISGFTFGETPTDEWLDEHGPSDDPSNPDDSSNPDDPSNPGDTPGGSTHGGDKPNREPGTAFVPDVPWDQIAEEYVVPEEPGDADMPPVLPASPKPTDDENGKADIVTTKVAQNLSRDDGDTYVGDVVRYTVTVSNTKFHTMWYDTIIRDEIPEGLEIVPGSIKATGTDGVEQAVPDSAYDAQTRVLAVTVGDLIGGKSASLVFDAEVTEAAVGKDVGNVASAHGTTPAGVEISTVVEGAPRPAAGKPFVPDTGWDEFLAEHPGASNAEPTYPSPNVGPEGGIQAVPDEPINEEEVPKPKPEPEEPEAPSGQGGIQDGLQDGTQGGQLAKAEQDGADLAKTGDMAGAAVPAVLLVALLAVAGMLALRRRTER